VKRKKTDIPFNLASSTLARKKALERARFFLHCFRKSRDMYLLSNLVLVTAVVAVVVVVIITIIIVVVCFSCRCWCYRPLR